MRNGHPPWCLQTGGIYVLGIHVLLLGAAWASPNPAYSSADVDLMELSLEELLDIEITSVSKKSQRLSEAAAAIFVVTQDDIRRSGATSIPEALRMVPGVQVARIDANKWAISARGFSSRFSNKLLVLIDGRSVYHPAFSGVFWDVQDTMLEDIERIEVIRGPGATLWGANAVNGVINIITKSAGDTQGGLLTVGAGSEERGFSSARYGAQAGENAQYRIFAKYFNRDGSVDAAGDDLEDDWHVARGGFRLDWEAPGPDSLTVQGDVYDGQSGERFKLLSLTPPHIVPIDEQEAVSGGNLLLRWKRTLSDQSDMGLQVYYDRMERDGPLFGEARNTYDIDFQHRLPFGERHDVLWGLAYRYTQGNIENTVRIVIDPDQRSDELFSGFVQDDIELVPERLKLTIGSKLEQNDYTGFEIQPNVRLTWFPDEKQTVWGSVARAVRTPNLSEHDTDALLQVIAAGETGNPFPVPLALSNISNDDFDSEELIAYELGYRTQLAERVSLDIAAFFNDYDELRGNQVGTTLCQPSGTPVTTLPPCFLFEPSVLTPLSFVNELEGETYGLEVAVDWWVSGWWRLQGAYSYLQIQLHAKDTVLLGEGLEKNDPHNQFSLRSSMDLRHSTELDLWLRYVDNLPGDGLHIDSYVTLDARIAWRPRNDIELSLVGQNLLDDQHAESVSELQDLVPTEVERSVYGKVQWTF